MKHLLSVIMFVVTTTLAQAAVVGKELNYQSGETQHKGFLAYDDSHNKLRPAVLVVHEWWGHNDYARKRAKMLAELGYIALAVDMYGDGKQADHPKDAGAFATQVRSNLPLAKQRFAAAMQVLQKHALTEKGKVAAIGYCFGGAVVLDMARHGVDLKGVVSFHGSLGTQQEAAPGAVKARVLVLTGEDDPMVKPEAVDKFKAEMKAANAKYEVISYKGVTHAFTNPAANELAKKFDLPVAYDQHADQDSWQQMKKFFSEVFK